MSDHDYDHDHERKYAESAGEHDKAMERHNATVQSRHEPTTAPTPRETGAVTYAEKQAWAERHGISIAVGDVPTAFDDAATLWMTRATPTRDRVREAREAVRDVMIVSHTLWCATHKRVRGRGSIDGSGMIYVASGKPCDCGSVSADARLDAYRDALLDAVDEDVLRARSGYMASRAHHEGFTEAVTRTRAAIRARKETT